MVPPLRVPLFDAADGFIPAVQSFSTSDPLPGYSQTFQIGAPPVIPNVPPACVVSLGWHSFANSYGQPWVIDNFSLPTSCGTQWSSITLQLNSSSKGRQFDRVYQVWIDGAEALRGCTDEPTKLGVYWSIEKDVTDFAPIFHTAKTITVGLDNINDATYTGIYNTTVSFTFYPASRAHPVPPNVPDILIPLQSGNLYPHIVLDGNIPEANFNVSNIPRNIKRVELEYFVSHHANDEFYYLNVPDEVANPNLGLFGGGNFKEIEVYLDGAQVGVDWPFQLVYTGGFDPSVWMPITHTRSEDFPSYRFDLTPFASKLADGQSHTIALNVTSQSQGALWYVDGSMRIWLDHTSATTSGHVDHINFPQTAPSVKIDQSGDGVDFAVSTHVAKTVSYSGSVGNLQTSVTRDLKFSSFLNFTQQTNIVVGYHNIDSTTETVVTDKRTGEMTSWSRTVVSYPLKLNSTFIPLSSDGSLYYYYLFMDHSRNIKSVSLGRRWGVSNEEERHVVKGYLSNSPTIPAGAFNANLHNATYQSLVANEAGAWIYGRDARAVNRTLVFDRIEPYL
ncbi:peptide N-acetyl-beta-D-glucosaminyl asparaginase amidase A-domain-containing protein [Chytriomyces sp. MP71]|nr:peptide N-acetyl-beta-D-glucosaminyl asparaginase amidase A-domain-containing protein [Chytriomyces sp. MP71]